MQEKNIPEQKKSDLQDSVNEAHEQAEQDIQEDPELNLEPKAGDDLDEGELARLEGHQ